MTDPRARRPEFWRTFAWAFAVAAVVLLSLGTAMLIAGGRTGWLNLILGVIFASQSVLYFWQYQRAKRDRE